MNRRAVGTWVATLVFCASAVRAAADAPAPGMVGGPGVDADGYPLMTADRRWTLQLLRARKFEELDAWLCDLQAQFEADYHKEYWPSDALDVFGDADSSIEPLLDEWVTAMPDSYMALAARGIHQTGVGWFRRGGKWARETPAENFREMRSVHELAIPDLDLALQRHPWLVAVQRALINVAKANGIPIDATREVLDRALAACPNCYQVRVSFMLALLPRWSGSYQEMQAFAQASAAASTNPKQRLLEGFVDSDKCDLLMQDRRLGEAIAACKAALEFGDTSEALETRARLYSKSGKLAAALADVDRALALRPQLPDLIEVRAWLRAKAHDYAGHARDIALLKEIAPLNGVERGAESWAAQGLAYEAGRKARAGRVSDEISLLEQAIALDPDKLDNYLRLDAALVRARQLAKIPPIWSRYLARHPKDTRAHLERAGALHHLGREREALDEASSACKLGEAYGCTIVNRYRATP